MLGWGLNRKLRDLNYIFMCFNYRYTISFLHIIERNSVSELVSE